MKLQIVNRQSKLVRCLPAFCVAGPYGGILHRRFFFMNYKVKAMYITRSNYNGG